MTIMERPGPAEYAQFFADYVSLVLENDIVKALEQQIDDVRRHAGAIPADLEQFRYAEGKWSIREVVGHVGDAERVFGYRAFCISRGDQTPLPGFDERHYIRQSDFHRCSLSDLVEEFICLRESNLIVLRRLDEDAWLKRGVANGSPVSVRALAFIMAGHVRHHLRVLSTRYAVARG
jgi:hypothetical protein